MTLRDDVSAEAKLVSDLPVADLLREINQRMVTTWLMDDTPNFTFYVRVMRALQVTTVDARLDRRVRGTR